ncbi:MAG TPA: hypothetical protein PK992_02080, partial [Planctomycetaceae bacterium]|nr:hypothetical protein [Planctomycetaceae bacterium]
NQIVAADRTSSRCVAGGENLHCLRATRTVTRVDETKRPSLTLAASATWPMLPVSVVNFHLPIT